MKMKMLWGLLWVYLRNLPLKFGQNQVAFVLIVVVLIHDVAVIVVVDPTNLPLKFG